MLWAFSITVMGEQTERAVGKELDPLVGTKSINVSCQHAQIKGQYWPPCPFGGHVGARIKHFSILRIVDHPSQVIWLMGLWLVAPRPMKTVISRRVKRAPVVRVSVSNDLMGEVLPPLLLAPFPLLLGGLLHMTAVNLGPDPVDLNSCRSGKENNIRAFPSRF